MPGKPVVLIPYFVSFLAPVRIMFLIETIKGNTDLLTPRLIDPLGLRTFSAMGQLGAWCWSQGPISQMQGYAGGNQPVLLPRL